MIYYQTATQGETSETNQNSDKTERLNNIIGSFTYQMWNNGYHPLNKALIVQNRHPKEDCDFKEVLNFDYGLCVNSNSEDESVINNDSSLSQNIHQKLYGQEGFKIY